MAEHVISQRTYYLVFLALIGLTVLTVGLGSVELGRWHLPIGLAIAAIKATLVALFFMHVLYSSRLTWVIVASAVFWLGVLFVLTLSDYLTRAYLAY